MEPPLLLLLLGGLPSTAAYCALFGQNPGFTAAPRVQQISLTSVLVSWEGLVTRIDCADQFIVKSWNERNPNDYQMSDLLPLDQFTFMVRDLVPNQNYVFQAVAREDKGILGKDWNKSPQALFRTGRTNPTVSPAGSHASFVNPTNLGQVKGGQETPKAMFTLGAIVVGILLGSLVLVGAVWNIIQRNRRKKSTDTDSEHSSDSDTDSMELDLENTDLESRVGSLRPPSRAGSRVSTVRSCHTLGRAGRVRSPPRRFSLTSEPELPPEWDACGQPGTP